MDWAASEWKEGLSGLARQKVEQLEDQLAKLLKMGQQRQLQNEQLEQALANQKKKMEEEKVLNAQLSRNLQTVCEQQQELRIKNEKLQLDMNCKENQLSCLEGQLVSNKSINANVQLTANQIEELQMENRDLKAKCVRLEHSRKLSGSLDSSFADKVGTPARHTDRHAQKSEDELVRQRIANDLLGNQVKELEQKLKNLSKELECQRHNHEAARVSFEAKFKQKENGYLEEIRQQIQAQSHLAKTLEETKSKLQQEASKSLALDSLRSQLEKDSTKLQKTEKECREQYQLVQEKTQQLMEFENIVAELKKTLQHSEKCQASIQARADASEVKVGNLEKDLKRGELETCTLRKELERATSFEDKCKSFSEKLASMEHTMAEKENSYKAAKTELDHLREKLEKQLLLNNDLKQESSAVLLEVKAKEKEIQEHLVNVERLNKLVAEKQQNIKQLEERFDKSSAVCQEKDVVISQLQTNLNSKDKELQEHQTNVDRLNKTVVEKQQNIGCLEQKVEKAMSSCEEKDRKITELQLNLEVKEKSLKESLARADSLEKLVADRDGSVKLLEQKVEKSLSSCQEKDLELAQFKSKLDAKETEIREHLVSLENLNKMVAEKQNGLSILEKKIEKELAASREKDSKLVEIQLKLEGKDKEIQEHVAVLGDLRRVVNEKEQCVKMLEGTVEKHRVADQEKELLVLELKTALDARNVEIQDCKTNTDKLNKALSEKQQAISVLEDKTGKYILSCEEKDKQISQLQLSCEALDKLQKDLAEATHNRERLENEALQLKMVLQDERDKVSKQKESIEPLKEEIHNLTKELHEVRNQAEEKSKQLEEQKEKLNLATSMLDDANNRHCATEAALNDLRESSNCKLSALDAQLSGKLDEVHQLNEKLHTLEEDLKSKELQLTRTEESLQNSEHQVSELQSSLVLAVDEKDKMINELKETSMGRIGEYENRIMQANLLLKEAKENLSSYQTTYDDLKRTSSDELVSVSQKLAENSEELVQLKEQLSAEVNKLSSKELELGVKVQALEESERCVLNLQHSLNFALADKDSLEKVLEEKAQLCAHIAKELEEIKEHKMALSNQLCEEEKKLHEYELKLAGVSVVEQERNHLASRNEKLQNENSVLLEEANEIHSALEGLNQQVESLKKQKDLELQELRKDLLAKSEKDIQELGAEKQNLSEEMSQLAENYKCLEEVGRSLQVELEERKDVQNECLLKLQDMEGSVITMVQNLCNKLSSCCSSDDVKLLILGLDKDKHTSLYSSFDNLISLLCSDVENRHSAQVENKRLAESLEDLKAELSSITLKCESEGTKSLELEEEINVKNINLEVLQKELKLLERDLEQYRNVSEKDRLEFETLERDLREHSERLEEEVKNQTVCISELRKEMDCRTEALNGHLEMCTQEKLFHEKELEDLRNRCEVLENTIAYLENSKNESEALNQRLQEVSCENEELLNNKSCAEEKLLLLQTTLTKCEADLQTAYAEYAENVAALKSKLSDVEEELDKTYDNNTKLLNDLQVKENFMSDLGENLKVAECKLVNNLNLINNLHSSVASIHSLLFPDESFSADSYSPDFFLSVLEKIRVEVVARDSMYKQFENGATPSKANVLDLSPMGVLDSVISRLNAVSASLGHRSTQIQKITEQGNSSINVDSETNDLILSPNKSVMSDELLTHEADLAARLSQYLAFVIERIKRLPMYHVTPLEEINQLQTELNSLKEEHEDLKIKFERKQEELVVAANQASNKIELSEKLLRVLDVPKLGGESDIDLLLDQLIKEFHRAKEDCQNKALAVESLNKVVDEVESYLQSTFEEKQKLEAELENMRAEDAAATKRVVDLEESVRELQSKIAQQEFQLNDLKQQYEAVLSEKCELQRSSERESELILELQSLVRTKTEDCERFVACVQERDVLLAEQHESFSCASKELAEMKDKCLLLEKQLENLRMENQEVQVSSKEISDMKCAVLEEELTASSPFSCLKIQELNEKQSVHVKNLQNSNDLETQVLELSDVKSQNDSLRNELVVLQQTSNRCKELETQVAELSEVKLQNDSLQNDLNILQQMLKDFEMQVAGLSEVKSQNDSLRTELDFIQQTASKCKELEAQVSELLEVKLQNESLRVELEMLQQTASNYKELEMQVVGMLQVKSQNDSLRTELDVLQQTAHKCKELEMQVAELSEVKSQNMSLKAELEILQQTANKFKELETQVVGLLKVKLQGNSLRAELEILQQTAEKYKELEMQVAELLDVKSKNDSLKKELDIARQTTSKYDELLTDYENLKRENEETKCTVEELQCDRSLIQRYCEEAAQVKNENRNLRDRIDDLEEELKQLHSMDMTVSSMIEAKLIAEATLNQLKEKICHLENQSVYSLEEIEQLKEKLVILNSTEEQLAEALQEGGNLKTLLKNFENKHEVMLANFDLVIPDAEPNSMTLDLLELSVSAAKAKLLGQEQEITGMRKEMQDLNLHSQNLEEQRLEGVRKLSEFETQNKYLNSELMKLKAGVNELSSQLEIAKILNGELEDRYESSQKKLQASQAEMESKKLELESRGEEYRCQAENFTEELSLAKEDRKRVEMELEDLRGKLETSEKCVQEKTEQLQTHLSNVGAMLKEKTLLEEACVDKQRQIDEVTAALEVVKVEAGELKVQLDQAKKDFDSAKGKIFMLNRNARKREKALVSFQEDLEKSENLKEALQEEIGTLEGTVKSYREKVKELEEQVEELRKKYNEKADNLAKLWETHGQLSAKIIEYESYNKLLQEQLQDKNLEKGNLDTSSIASAAAGSSTQKQIEMPQRRGKRITLMDTPEAPAYRTAASGLPKTPHSPVLSADPRPGILTRIDSYQVPSTSVRTTRRRSRSSDLQNIRPQESSISTAKKVRLFNQAKLLDLGTDKVLPEQKTTKFDFKSTTSTSRLGPRLPATRSTSGLTSLKSTNEAGPLASAETARRPLGFSLESNSGGNSELTTGFPRRLTRRSSKEGPGECNQQ